MQKENDLDPHGSEKCRGRGIRIEAKKHLITGVLAPPTSQKAGELDMSLSEESKMAKRKRGLLWGAPCTAFWGLLAFSGVASNPRFETIHTLDVMRLMIAGASFAVALGMLILFFNLGPRFEDKRTGAKSGEESN